MRVKWCLSMVLVSLKRVYGPETVTRNNLFNAVTINGIPKPGYSTGDAIKAIQEVAANYLPRGYSYEWSGMTKGRDRRRFATNTHFSAEPCVCLFLLAAQYERYILPLAVIFPFLPEYLVCLPSLIFSALKIIFMCRWA